MKSLTLKVPEELHNNFKIIAVREKTTMTGLILNFMKDYCRRVEEDKISIEIFSYDELSPEEKKKIDRGREEFAKGEYQDFDDMVKELEDESNCNEIG